MKMTKKIVALVSALAITASFAVSASAALELNAATATASVDTVAAGESVTIYAGWDTLVGAQGVEIKVEYDDTAFDVDSSNNTSYNFGTAIKKSYLPKFIEDSFVASRFAYLKNEEVDDNFSVTTLFPSLTAGINPSEKAVKYMFVDTSGEVEIDEELNSYGASTNIGTIFTAKADIQPGTYTFTCSVVVSAGSTGVTKTASVDVVVEGGEEGGEGEGEETAEAMVAGVDTITAEGRHYGKSSIATPEAVSSTGLAKIVVTNSDSEDVQTWEAPATLGDGKSSVLGIITYNKADWMGSTFTMNFLDATNAIIKAFTYTVQ